MDIQESQKLINIYLDLDRDPVGVKFLKTQEEYDACPAEERDHRVSYCNSVNLASKGKALKLRKEHQACMNGSAALCFKEVAPGIASGKGRLSKNIYKDLEVSKSVSDEMDFMEEPYFGIAVMPLEQFTEEPDVVIVISGSYNVMRLVQGYSYNYGYTPNLKTVGLQAVCHDLTTYPLKTDDINISLLCPGTRQVADWKEYELGIGIARSKWYDIVNGVIETTNPFARNPIKKEIIKKLNAAGMDSSNIILNQNYDTGTYVGGKVEPEAE